jgi:energy-coupling factor transporter ATP-binding protein EcfA2
MLDMAEFSEAVVGVPGEGLNVEQRKLLTIGVELAAKPTLLIFLDEPTSGLDSQSSWAIVRFLRKLADSGQAILSTIHQPSSILFLEFDQLLFLARGGKTVYFGEIGLNAKTLLHYFEAHGARPCGESENPAEYILETVAAGASGLSKHDWPDIWKSSDEYRDAKAEQERIHHEISSMSIISTNNGDKDEFAMPLYTQIVYTTFRVFQQYWRTPSYIWGKILLGVVSALWVFLKFFMVQGLCTTASSASPFSGRMPLYRVHKMSYSAFLCSPQFSARSFNRRVNPTEKSYIPNLVLDYAPFHTTKVAV